MPDYPNENDLKTIQGLVVRGYPLRRVAHFVLEVKNPAGARAFIYSLVRGSKITTAEYRPESERRDQPALNIGFTYNGFKALGLDNVCTALEKSAAVICSELEPFVQGAAQRAERVGDVGDSSPDRWFPAFNSDRAHVLLSMYHPKSLSEPDTAYEQAKMALEEQARDSGMARASLQEGQMLDDDTFHFGFKDGFAQPKVKGFPLHKHAEDGDQPISPAGAFLLGYPSQFEGLTYRYEFPEVLGRNGTFAAFRVLLQNVDAFEAYLQRISVETGTGIEDVAAQVCGRRRDGTPLMPANDINDFNYSSDPEGKICPFSAHIRRANPRDDRIAGGDAFKRRLIRRGMPFGIKYDPARPNDGVPRGLLGFFFCASLRDQFEFVVKNWLNRGGFQRTLAADSLDDFSHAGKFVSTRGALYCFMPSLQGLEYIGKYV